MTSTTKSDLQSPEIAFQTDFAGLILVLKRSNATSAMPLFQWLPDLGISLSVVTLGNNINLTKLFIAIDSPEYYPKILQEICCNLSKLILVEWQDNIYEVTGIEVDKSPLHILQIPIYPSRKLPQSLGLAIHALCYHWLHLGNPNLSEKIHGQNVSPITLSLNHCKSGNKVYLKIGLLQKYLLAPLLCGLASEISREILIAGIPCKLGNRVEILQSSSFEQLSQIPPETSIVLEFLSLTSFRQNKVTQPFPLPSLVFGGLLRRWNIFSRPELEFPTMEWEGITSAFDLKTKTTKLKADWEIGSVGWVRYHFPESQAQISTTLAHFATFAGVGRKTAMGMGEVRVGEWGVGNGE
jgi:CRISPR-associated endoribonuclease Cas6